MVSKISGGATEAAPELGIIYKEGSNFFVNLDTKRIHTGRVKKALRGWGRAEHLEGPAEYG